MIPVRFSQLELNRELNAVIASRVKNSWEFEPGIESSRHLK